jgi:hypothetical protein
MSLTFSFGTQKLEIVKDNFEERFLGTVESVSLTTKIEMKFDPVTWKNLVIYSPSKPV